MLRLVVRDLNDDEKNIANSVPQIALDLLNEKGEEHIDTTYIYPMKGYCFQIGGLNAMGADVYTTVVGFGNIISAFKNHIAPNVNRTIYMCSSYNITIDILNAFAMEAVMKYYKYIIQYANEYSIDEPIKIDIDMSYVYEDDNQSKQVWKKFIEETYASINEMVEKDMGN